jgi:filamentous hemagglutinin family protein
MQPNTLRYWCFSGSIFLWLLASMPSTAQITPDNTLPANSTVTPQGNSRVIEGGTRLGNNLFHSFREFSFSVLTSNTTGNTAYFNINNDSTLRNIITRVTGGSPSNIDGTIRANGSANLFFINPNGIIFGANASLQIGGSFIASTANSLKFADGTEYSASAPQNSPVLTVSVPIGLQFGSNPGPVVNQSQASPNRVTNTFGLPVGLQVKSGKTLALVGGNVSLDGGNLTAAGGSIELGSVAGTSLVNLKETATGYALAYTGVENFRDIQLSQGSVVDASSEGGGNIQLQGRDITLTETSEVLSYTLGAKPGGSLVINAAESVNLSGDKTILSTGTFNIGNAGSVTVTTRTLKLEGGANIISFTLGKGNAGNVLVKASDSVELVGTTSDGRPTALGSQVCTRSSTDCGSVTGNGGNLTVETQRLLIQGGARMEASTFGVGRGGDILVNASDFVELIGASPNGQATSGISSQVAQGSIPNAGDAGNVTISTKRLIALDGGQVSTATFSGGDGGALTINASEFIQLSGASPVATPKKYRSGVFVSAEPEATGDVGALNISTGRLIVENGAEISANNAGTGRGGTASLNTRQLIIRDGGWVGAGSRGEGPGGTLNVNAIESVQVTGTGTIGSDTIPSSLFTLAEASGEAGDLNITTKNLNVQDGAEVNVSGLSSGPAGNLTITANSIALDRGRLTGETQTGSGANITLQNVDLLFMRNQSLISAQAFNNGDGGNIAIDAGNGFIVAVPDQDSDIIANAFEGRGGNIDITTQSLFGIEQRRAIPGNGTNDIDASSQFGLNGTITINRPDVDPSRGLANLSTEVVDASNLIASGCGQAVAQRQSKFVVTGRGGLPDNPSEALSSDTVWSDLRLPTTVTRTRSAEPSATQPTNSTPKQLVEAQGWIINDKGKVILTAQAVPVVPHSSWQTTTTCPTQ